MRGLRHTISIVENKSLSSIFEFFKTKSCNTTIACWDKIITMGSPIIKVQILKENPYLLENVNDWRNVLKNNTSYNGSLIENHLKRIKKDKK